MMSFPPVAVRHDVTPDTLAKTVESLEGPVIFKGLVADWPVVQAGLEGADALIDYLKARDNGTPAETFRQAPGEDGRYFYTKDQSGRNFARAPVPPRITLDRLRAIRGQEAEHIYIQSAPLERHMPRVKAENRLPGIAAEPRIWIGNRSHTQIHFDLYDNLACMVGGQKSFVLFPPEQVGNLYMGPFENTLAGVPAAMVSLDNPDFEAHPRFAEALETATIAVLEPGDVLFIPYMWWHHVISDGDFNVQINYWWNPAPDMGAPMQALFHAMLSVRDLPASQNRAWKGMFYHFVFHQSGETGVHLRPELRGLQGALTDDQRIAFRKALGQRLQED